MEMDTESLRSSLDRAAADKLPDGASHTPRNWRAVVRPLDNHVSRLNPNAGSVDGVFAFKPEESEIAGALREVRVDDDVAGELGTLPRAWHGIYVQEEHNQNWTASVGRDKPA